MAIYKPCISPHQATSLPLPLSSPFDSSTRIRPFNLLLHVDEDDANSQSKPTLPFSMIMSNLLEDGIPFDMQLSDVKEESEMLWYSTSPNVDHHFHRIANDLNDVCSSEMAMDYDNVNDEMQWQPTSPIHTNSIETDRSNGKFTIHNHVVCNVNSTKSM